MQRIKKTGLINAGKANTISKACLTTYGLAAQKPRQDPAQVIGRDGCWIDRCRKPKTTDFPCKAAKPRSRFCVPRNLRDEIACRLDSVQHIGIADIQNQVRPVMAKNKK